MRIKGNLYRSSLILLSVRKEANDIEARVEREFSATDSSLDLAIYLQARIWVHHIVYTHISRYCSRGENICMRYSPDVAMDTLFHFCQQHFSYARETPLITAERYTTYLHVTRLLLGFSFLLLLSIVLPQIF